MDMLFSIVPVFIGIVILFFIYTIIKNMVVNKSKPKIAAAATVVTKRQSSSSNSDNSFINTWYHVTFEFTTRDRIELSVSGSEYGMLAERDKGILTFQGNSFISFERT
jgi:Protein of unknown function (DUF2500)